MIQQAISSSSGPALHPDRVALARFLLAQVSDPRRPNRVTSPRRELRRHCR